MISSGISPQGFWRQALLSLLVAGAVLWSLGVCTLTYAQDLSREQALLALEDGDPATRFAGALRLAAVGEMIDSETLVRRLRDDDAKVRAITAAVLGEIWGRSDDEDTDRQLREGYDLMQTWKFSEALEVFNAIVLAKPDFAEGWNKRATVLFLMGEMERSLADCEEVIRRNPLHFGALSGAGMVEMELGHLDRALSFFKRALSINPHMRMPVVKIQQIQELLKQRREQTV